MVLEKTSGANYKDHLRAELKEIRESEMWQAGAQVRSLRPNKDRRITRVLLTYSGSDRSHEILPDPLFLTKFAVWASLIRPAPAEFPQDRKVARVGGCSGAI